MKLLKPTWVHHETHPIFCIDIHPDGTRFVTGGQGNDSVGRIVIWNMKPVLKQQVEQENYPQEDTSGPKLFCQLDHHNACVNSVRWSHSGRFLASGGDDRIIIIWRLTAKTNPNSIGRKSETNCIFGKVAYETWKPLSTLRGHAGDVLDLSWSPDDKYLASASVDNTIIIWDAQNFPRILTELKGHTSLVKGITWDPVGKYIASQSDDKSLKIWRTADWSLEQTIEDPFHECGGTTHVLRLDWSPDGLYLVSAHAMNGGGPTAQIIDRDGWKTDKDFVGHRKAVVCVRFNPNILQKGENKFCCLALGSRDRSISIWSTSLKRPVIVVKDVFTNSVMDLAWSSCGTVMMACSWDGTIAVTHFLPSEIGKPLSNEEMSSLHCKMYGENLTKAKSAAPSKIIQNVEVFLARKDDNVTVPEKQQDLEVTPKKNEYELVDTTTEIPTVARGPTDKQIETRTPDGKRRITPKFLPNIVDSTLLTIPTTNTTIFQNSEHSNQSNLRDNMVSGIEDVKIDGGEAKQDEVPIPMDTQEPLQTSSRGFGQPLTSDSQSAKPEVQNSVEVNGLSLDGPPKLRIEPVWPPTPSNSEPPKELVKTNGEVETPRTSDISGTPALSSASTSFTPAPISIKRRTSDEMKAKLAKKPKITTIETIQEAGSSYTPVPGPSTLVPRPTPVVPPSTTIISTPIQSQAPPQPKPHSTTKSPQSHRRLNPMKIAGGVLTVKVNKKPDIKYILEVENKLTGRKWNYILRCLHEQQQPTTNFSGLNWTLQTEAPICGVTGDAFRVVMVCEDATVHVLDLKGRYAFPPLVVSSVPSKVSHNGAYLLVITTKATMHVWNIHTKKSVKTESIMPLVNQPTGTDSGGMNKLTEIAHASVTSSGVPRIILNNGKSFLFNRDMGSWMVMSDPTISHAGDVLPQLEFDPKCRRTGVISQIKLRLATATELERTDDVREWLIVLAKSLATQGLRAELRQLCEDLMGPSHSGAKAKVGNWSPTIVGVDKRGVLKIILDSLLKDLAFQDLYSEFQDVLDQEEIDAAEDDNDEDIADPEQPEVK